MARVSRPTTANKIVACPNWDVFAHAAHASQLGSCNTYTSNNEPTYIMYDILICACS